MILGVITEGRTVLTSAKLAEIRVEGVSIHFGFLLTSCRLGRPETLNRVPSAIAPGRLCTSPGTPQTM